MRVFCGAIALSVGVLAQMAIAQAPQPALTPAEIVCQLSGDCDPASQPDASKKVERGEEAGFNFRALTSTTATTPAEATAAHSGAAVRMASATMTSSRPRFAPRAPAGISVPIAFDNGSAAMTETGIANAQSLATAMLSPSLSGHKFVIEGHTNSVGSRDANLKLSQSRAETVADYLKQQGVPAAQIEAKGFGFDKPLPNLSSRAAANRRVQVVPLG